MEALTPLYTLKSKIAKAEEELEELKREPSTNHEEIAKIDSVLLQYKLEYADRVAGLKVSG